jgi:replication-associated recombination protein RarA
MRPTRNGHDPLIIVSLLQKSLRRGETELAAWAANELLLGGYAQWMWRRIQITAAEDCAALVHEELQALQAADTFERKARSKEPTRVFAMKAIVLLSRAAKSRDADHLSNLVVDRIGDTDPDLLAALREAKADPEVPDWAFDVHTMQGRRMGRTKADFFRSEHAALSPRIPGLFDDLID